MSIRWSVRIGREHAARHNDSLTYEELLEGVNRLLTEDGLFTVVIPTDVVDRVKAIASMNKLYAIRQLNVITKPGGIPKRTLIAFSFSNQGVCDRRTVDGIGASSI